MPSLKTVLNGEEIYHFDDRSIRIQTGEFLLVPAGQAYEVQIDTRFETVGRCFYFDSSQSAGFERLQDVMGHRLHHLNFLWAEMDRWPSSSARQLNPQLLSHYLMQWSCRWLDQADRLDRVDPLARARLLNGLQRAHRCIQHSYAEPWTVSKLAERAHLSRASFTRSFTRLYGLSPKRMLQKTRLQVAAAQIEQGHECLTTIALNCGYADLPTFSRAFRRHFGVAPSCWTER
ncbi:MAG: AraC family transcriptional regulator [Pseudomonadota bacterium]